VSVVSNASPLINLARIGQLGLLRQLYGELTLPEAVWHEVVVEGSGQPGAERIGSASWVRVQSVCNRQLVQALRQELDAGEAEAIALALEVDVEFLLMDEHLGRDTAQHMGVRSVGLVGVLVEAKHKGLVGGIQPLLDALRDVAGFWVSEALYRRVLEDEGESTQESSP
jgi:predicted nucleic acid-binding protein